MPARNLLSTSLLCGFFAGLISCTERCREADEKFVEQVVSRMEPNPTAANLLLLEVCGLDKVQGIPALSMALETPLPPEINSTETVALLALEGHTRSISDASFNADGSRIVTASIDNTAMIWAAKDRTLLCPPLYHDAAVFSASFLPGSNTVITTDGKRVMSWEACFAPRAITSFEGRANVTVAGHSPNRDGSLLWVTASHDKSARIWETKAQEANAWTPIHCLGRFCANQDGRKVAGHTEIIKHAEINSDGSRVLTASDDQTAKVWSATTGDLIQTLDRHEAEIKVAKFVPLGTDDQLILTADRNIARLWFADRKNFHKSLEGHHDSILDAAISPDGQHIVTGSSDKTARFWQVSTGEEDRRLTGHKKAVRAVAYSPDGKWVATTSDDGTLRLWEPATGLEVAAFGGNGDTVTAVEFAPDSKKILTWSDQGNIARLWLWTTPGEVARYLQSRIRARTRLCLSDRERQALLQESPKDAAAARQACEQCMPEFFKRLGQAEPHEWQVHLTAWDSYKSCEKARIAATQVAA